MHSTIVFIPLSNRICEYRSEDFECLVGRWPRVTALAQGRLGCLGDDSIEPHLESRGGRCRQGTRSDRRRRRVELRRDSHSATQR